MTQKPQIYKKINLKAVLGIVMSIFGSFYVKIYIPESI